MCPPEDLSRRLSRPNSLKMSITFKPHFCANPLMHPPVGSCHSKAQT